MGFFDFLKGEEEVREVSSLDEARVILKKKLNRASSTDFAKTRGLEKRVRELLRMLESFQDAEPREEINPYLLNKITSSRDSFVTRMKSHAQKTKQLSINTFEELEESMRRVSHFLEKASEMGKDYSGKLGLGFKKQVSRIGEKLESISDEFMNVKQAFDERNDRRQEFIRVLETMDELKSLEEKLSKAEQDKKEIKEKASKTRSQVEGIVQEIEELKQSEEMKQFRTMREQLREADEKIETLKSLVTSKISKASKALRKYANTQQDPELDQFIEDPLSIMDSSKIMIWLNDLRSMIEKQGIKLKPKRKMKAMKALEKLDKQYFDKTHSRIAELLVQKKTVEKMLESSNVKQELDSLKDQLSILESSLKNTEELIEKKRSRIENIKQAIQSKKEEALKELRGHGITIDYLSNGIPQEE